MDKTKVLIVDDEASILRLLRINLEEAGFEVVAAVDGVDALAKVEKALPNLVILDISMPKMDGFEVCRRIREWSNIPIIMLTARAEQRDILKAFDLGADDYLLKPFSVGELSARVKAVLRRSGAGEENSIVPAFVNGNLRVDFANRNITLAGKPVGLTPTEYSLVRELATNAGKVLTHAQLLTKVWGQEYRDEREYLHVFMARLRAKLEKDASGQKYITTVSGVGYQFISPA